MDRWEQQEWFMNSSSINADGPLFVMHIPKTAGTSLASVLMQFVPAEDVFTFYPGEAAQLDALQDRIKESIPRMVVGHFRFGLHEGFTSVSKYFTLFRDPVDRVISHFNYMATSENPVHREIIRPGEGIEKFIEHDWARNFQTNYLTNWSPADIEADPVGAFECATQILSTHFITFGIAERLAESLQPLADHFGWRLPPIPRLNRTEGNERSIHRRDLSPELLARIMAVNQCDARLHSYARERVMSAQKSPRPRLPWRWLP